ncbi:MAG: DNA primase [Oscillospiraceae bacterium]
MPLPSEFLEEILERNDMAEVAGGYTKLQRSGKRYRGLCPFHNEKTPSFFIFPDTRSFYCFGCGAGGDVITFIEKAENLTYIEAVRFLAQRAGMEMPEDTDNKVGRLRTRILAANREAARFFYAMLNTDSGREARGYLRRRGLRDSTITRFGIGYSPDSWDLLRNALRDKGFTDDEMIAAGLCKRSSKGSVYDFFRNRVMFPVIDLSGNVVAFSGRRLREEDSPRKYVNTGDTLVFKKSRILFAMNLAKNSISKNREIILAEGQMDAISMHQAGFDNAVAALGTALTDEHIKIMANYADSVVLAYDSDDAGRKATARAISMFRASNISVKVLEIPGAKDADEYIKKYGADSFRQLIERSSASTEYELRRAAAKYDLDTDDGKVRYLREATDILSRTYSPTERDIYAGRLSEQLGVSKDAILSQIGGNAKRRERAENRRREREMSNVTGQYGIKSGERNEIGRIVAERRLVALIFKNPDKLGRAREKLGGAEIADPVMKKIFAAMAEKIDKGGFSGFSSLGEELSEEEMSALARAVADADSFNFASDDVDYLCEKIRQADEKPGKDEIGEMDPENIKNMIEKNSGGIYG